MAHTVDAAERVLEVCRPGGVVKARDVGRLPLRSRRHRRDEGACRPHSKRVATCDRRTRLRWQQCRRGQREDGEHGACRASLLNWG
eukprot:4184746-Prymnesium_polylepis.1